MLLSRDTNANAAGIKDLNLDLTTWEPLISMQTLAQDLSHKCMSVDLHLSGIQLTSCSILSLTCVSHAAAHASAQADIPVSFEAG